MTRYSHPITPFAAALIAMGLLIQPPAWAEQDQIEANRDKIEELQRQIEALRAENERLRTKAETATDTEAEKPTDPAPDQDEAAADSDSDPTRQDIEALRQQNQELQRELEAARSSQQDLETEKQTLEKLAGVTAKGEQVESQAALFQTTYDPATDTTTVIAKPKIIPSDSSLGFTQHRLGGRFTHAGRTPTEPPPAITIELLTFANSNRAFKSARNVTFLADDEPVPAAVEAYELISRTRTPRTLKRTGSATAESRDERITFRLDADRAAAVGRASTLKLEVANVTYHLSREHTAMIEALRLRAWGGAGGQ